MDEFRQLRKEIDHAITFGHFRLAQRLAQKGLQAAQALGAKSQESSLKAEEAYFKGQIEILKGDYIEAINHFDRAIRYNPNDGAAFNDRALCMVELGVIDRALDYFDKGIKAEPDYATVYHNKGWLLNQIGRYSQAIECFNRALQLEPGRAVTYENLANALANLNDYQGALKAYQKTIDLLSPEYSDIKEQVSAQMRLIKERLGHGFTRELE